MNMQMYQKCIINYNEPSALISLFIQKLQVHTSPDYSHSSLCPPAGSILRILHIVANIEPLPLLSPQSSSATPETMAQIFYCPLN